jgi:hypothetical protein
MDINQRVIFVASCQHSGSTLLDLMLGTHPQLVGLGEVYSLIDPKYDLFCKPELRRCSCGSSLAECAFWGRVCSELKGRRNLDARRRYDIVFAVFREVFGPDVVPIDSSKHVKALRTLYEIGGQGVEVIHLAKDVRA